MTNNPQSIDKRLIELGKKCILEHGISFLSVRQICNDSAINLGLFCYYFKTKKNFIQILVKSFVEDIEKMWVSKSSNESDSLKRLKKALLMSVRVMKEKKGIFEALVRSIDFTDDFYLELAKDFQKKWNKFFLDMIDDCKKDNYFSSDTDTEQICSLLVGSLNYYSKIISERCEPEELYVKANDMLEFLIKILELSAKNDKGGNR
ncbi:MAG: TetR/AcrR family transcriptional regulator [Elusimicrobiota bacterium]|jgi:AcrR family transcriptional regulator|nr:TetR/AcrR family transcriptional regulator [Elusimicrobiota bacterium]